MDGDGDPDDGDLGKTDSGLDERLYYCTDAGCNVTALVTAAGTVVERYAYDPYGQPIFYDGSWGSQSSSSHGNAILYGGYYFDAETGFYHVRNRMYHAQLGRWHQRDPLGYVDGMSLYEYCGSGPIDGVDPSGLEDSKPGRDITDTPVKPRVEDLIDRMRTQPYSITEDDAKYVLKKYDLILEFLQGEVNRLRQYEEHNATSEILKEDAHHALVAAGARVNWLMNPFYLDLLKRRANWRAIKAYEAAKERQLGRNHTWTLKEVLDDPIGYLMGQNKHLRNAAVLAAAAQGRPNPDKSGDPETSKLYYSTLTAIMLATGGREILGAKGTQVTSKTTWQGKGGRIDVENPAPGQRPGQVHYQDSAGNKYLYDLETGQFKNAPPSVNKLLEDDSFRKGIEKGLKYLGVKS